MAWTAPKTWSSEPLTSLDLNSNVRDNLNHLKDRLDSSAGSLSSAASPAWRPPPPNLSMSMP